MAGLLVEGTSTMVCLKMLLKRSHRRAIANFDSDIADAA